MPQGWIAGKPRTQETRERISATMKERGQGKRPNGFNTPARCDICGYVTTVSNIKRHRVACEERNTYARIFGHDIPLSELKVMRGNFRRLYGITLDDYAKMFDAQKGVCAICFNPCNRRRFLAVDHCHTTKQVRGLLCSRCNMAIGLFEDNTEYLISAADYCQSRNGSNTSAPDMATPMGRSV